MVTFYTIEKTRSKEVDIEELIKLLPRSEKSQQISSRVRMKWLYLNLDWLKLCLDNFYKDTGEYPSNLAELWKKGIITKESYHQVFIKNNLTNKIKYVVNEDRTSYTLSLRINNVER